MSGCNRSVVQVWTCGRANRTLALSTASTGRCPLCTEGPHRIGSLFDDACPTAVTPDTGLTERLRLDVWTAGPVTIRSCRYSEPTERGSAPHAPRRLPAPSRRRLGPASRWRSPAPLVRGLPGAAEVQRIVRTMQRDLEEIEGVARRGVVLRSLMRFKQTRNRPSQVSGDSDYRPRNGGKSVRLAEICEGSPSARNGRWCSRDRGEDAPANTRRSPARHSQRREHRRLAADPPAGTFPGTPLRLPSAGVSLATKRGGGVDTHRSPRRQVAGQATG